LSRQFTPAIRRFRALLDDPYINLPYINLTIPT